MSVTITFEIDHPWFVDADRREAFRSSLRQEAEARALEGAVVEVLVRDRGFDVMGWPLPKARLVVDDEFDALRPEARRKA